MQRPHAAPTCRHGCRHSQGRILGEGMSLPCPIWRELRYIVTSALEVNLIKEIVHDLE